MTMLRVQSRSLSAVGYEERQKRLRVEFNSGKIYNYFGVPEETFRDLMKAESKGRFLNRWIRDSFPYEEEISPKSSGASA
jgi:hypothetical protein